MSVVLKKKNFCASLSLSDDDEYHVSYNFTAPLFHFLRPVAAAAAAVGPGWKLEVLSFPSFFSRN